MLIYFSTYHYRTSQRSHRPKRSNRLFQPYSISTPSRPWRLLSPESFSPLPAKSSSTAASSSSRLLRSSDRLFSLFPPSKTESRVRCWMDARAFLSAMYVFNVYLFRYRDHETNENVKTIFVFFGRRWEWFQKPGTFKSKAKSFVIRLVRKKRKHRGEYVAIESSYVRLCGELFSHVLNASALFMCFWGKLPVVRCALLGRENGSDLGV